MKPQVFRAGYTLLLFARALSNSLVQKHCVDVMLISNDISLAASLTTFLMSINFPLT